MKEAPVHVVDMFCGAGGLTRGLKNAGLDVIAGIDADGNCKYPYEQNNGAKFIHRDVRSVDPVEIDSLFPENGYRVLAGCAPCQPFTRLGNLKGEPRVKDWDLLKCFTKVAEHVRPHVVSMENVPSLVRHEVFGDFLLSLSDLGYHVDAKVVQCERYGVPQARRRLVVLASRLGKLELASPKKGLKPRTVRSAIGNLEPLRAGSSSRKDPLHRARNLTEINQRRISQSRPGGTWRDWDEALRLNCHGSESGKSFDSVYGRMEWDRPSPTITTEFSNLGSGRFGHPEQDRAITPREAALLQTFGKGYRFLEPGKLFSFTALGRWIGNAVPVKLAKEIGLAIRGHIDEFD